MALPMDTPSRIWRRIEEGEARIDDMPSLPSLPAFDDSELSERELSFSRMPHALSSRPSVTRTHSLSSSSGTAHNAEPPFKPYFPGESIHEEPVRAKDGKMDASFDVHSLRDSYDNDDQEEGQRNESSFIGALSRSRQIPVSESDEEDISLTEALASVSRTPSPLPPSDGGFSLQDSTSVPNIDAINIHDIDPSLSKTFPSHDHVNVAVRRHHHGVTRPPELSHSASSLSSSASSAVPKGSPPSSGQGDNVHSTVGDNVSGNPGTINPGGYEDVRVQAGSRSGENNSGLQQEISSAEETKEATFSSDDALSSNSRVLQMAQHLLPMPPLSAVSTPTPPYSRLSNVPNELCEQISEANDLATPLPRRKSFLLSVVNSTARPRLSNPKTGLTPSSETVKTFRLGLRKPRGSHPLSQTHTFEPSTPSNGASSGNDGETTPGAAGASFISTASSHDLTVGLKANASFDPLMGPQGIGRFNAGKLNTYLHSLNRRLQEENESLVERMKTQQEEIETLERLLRRGELSEVREQGEEEQWVMEKEAMEKKLHGLQDEIVSKANELEEERKERMRDKERWKERMSEVEKGVGDIVRDMELRLDETEKKADRLQSADRRANEAEITLIELKAECQLLRERANQAENIVANEQDLGSELRKVNDVRDHLERKLQSSALRLRETEDDLAASRAKIAVLEKDVLSLMPKKQELQSELRSVKDEADSLRRQLTTLDEERKTINDELRVMHDLNDVLKVDVVAATNKTNAYARELRDLDQRLLAKDEALVKANEQVAISADELAIARMTVKRLDDALQESDENLMSSSKELADLRTRLAKAEREKSRSPSQSHNGLLRDIDTEAPGAELDEAKEIARLNSILNQSPARKAIEKAKDTRIEILEKENEALLNQLLDLRCIPSINITPRHDTNMSGVSMLHQRLINLSLRTPRTPGEPLHDASWLMNVTGDISASHLLGEINRLQQQLDSANDSIDDKLDKLEEAGLGVVGLSKALEEARFRISTLEEQLAYVKHEHHDLKDTKRSQCPDGSDSYKSGTKNSDVSQIQLKLALVTAELDAVRGRRDQELTTASGEKAALQDAAKRLNAEINYAREELKAAFDRGQTAEKTKVELEMELGNAKKAIGNLEQKLSSERSRLRAMSTEQSLATREKDKILEKLRQTELKMESARNQLSDMKKANIKLRAETQPERDAAALEEELIGNKEVIDQLREERSRLAERQYALRQRLSEATSHMDDLSEKHASLQRSYNGRRQQLDLQNEEIEELRLALTSRQTTEFQSEKPGNASDRTDVRSALANLENDLRRVEQEAERFGRELRQVSTEKNRLEARHHGKSSDQDVREVEDMKVKHKRECKGLIVQIRYLKAKFTREASFRDHLNHQKQYLLTLLSRFEKSEGRILATIAQVGFPLPPQSISRRKPLRVVVLLLIFVARAKRASAVWRDQQSSKEGIAGALRAVRTTRTLKSRK